MRKALLLDFSPVKRYNERRCRDKKHQDTKIFSKTTTKLMTCSETAPVTLRAHGFLRSMYRNATVTSAH